MEFWLPQQVEYSFLGRTAPSGGVEPQVTEIGRPSAPDSGCVAKEDEVVQSFHSEITRVAGTGSRGRSTLPSHSSSQMEHSPFPVELGVAAHLEAPA
jgi:hypothetical protein